MKLISEISGNTINPGDEVTTFRGEVGKLISAIQPRHAGSTGHVHISFDGSACGAVFYPSVIGAKFVEEDVLSCGCCRGPENDRCCCHIHQDISRGLRAHKCSRHGGVS